MTGPNMPDDEPNATPPPEEQWVPPPPPGWGQDPVLPPWAAPPQPPYGAPEQEVSGPPTEPPYDTPPQDPDTDAPAPPGPDSGASRPDQNTAASDQNATAPSAPGEPSPAENVAVTPPPFTGPGDARPSPAAPGPIPPSFPGPGAPPPYPGPPVAPPPAYGPGTAPPTVEGPGMAQPPAQGPGAPPPPYDPGQANLMATAWDAQPSNDPWRIPPQPLWDPSVGPPPTTGPQPPYETARPDAPAPPQYPPYEPRPGEPVTLTGYDPPPSATSPRSTPLPPDRVPGRQPPIADFDEPWRRRETPKSRLIGLHHRTALLTVALVALVGMVIGGSLMLIKDGGSGRKSSGPPAELASSMFTSDPAATTDGLDQWLTGIAADGTTVIAIGGENDGLVTRPLFLVSANGGRSFRLATVQTVTGEEPPYGDAPKLIAATNGAWVALGTRADGVTVWTSRDGRSWIRQPDAAGAAFGATDRISRVAATTSGFVAVGSTSAKGDFSDPTPVVWRSTDGRRWDRFTGAQLSIPANGALSLVGVAASGNTIIAHGVGSEPGKHPKPIDGLWRSTDSRTWAAVEVPNPVGAKGFGIAATPSGLFLAREASDKSGRYAAVYGSRDGGHWAALGSIRLPGYDHLVKFSGSPQGLAAVAATGRNVVLIHSIDGTSWQSAGDVSSPTARIFADVLQTSGQTILVGRDNGGADANALLTVRDGQGQDIPVPLSSISGVVQADKAVDGVAAANGRIVAVGSTNGDPAVWTSTDGRAWQRARTPSVEGGQRLTSVTAGNVGWLAVGFDGLVPRRPLVLSSTDGSDWHRTDQTGEFKPESGAHLSTYSATMGPAGYVVVGEDGFSAATWLSTDLKVWQRGEASNETDLKGTNVAGRWMRDVVGGAFGYVAVGGLNDPAAHSATPTRAAVWTSRDGRKWVLQELPLPAGTVGAWLEHVSASGMQLVATGNATGQAGSRAFAFASADSGKTWREVPLPQPDAAPLAVTAESITSKGFVVAGTVGRPGATDVVLWKSVDGSAWTIIRPEGTGLSGKGDQELKGLAAVGADLLGIGVTASHMGQVPTVWRRPLP